MKDFSAKTYNFYALALVIRNPSYTVDTAIEYFSPTVDHDQLRQIKADAKHAIDLEMALMKETMTYAEIGAIFDLGKHAIYKRIMRSRGL